LALTVVGMILAIYIILSGIMTESYKKLEIQTSIQNSKRVYNALYNKIESTSLSKRNIVIKENTRPIMNNKIKKYLIVS